MAHVADVIYFGAILPCKVCSNGNYVFDGNTSYLCTGRLSAFGDCNKRVKEPERQPVEIPDILLEAFPFLNKEFKVQHRTIKDNPRPPNPKQARNSNRVLTCKSNNKEMILKGIKFDIF